MPHGFWFPSPATRVWTAAPMNPENRSGRYTLVGRIAEGQTLAHMDGPLRALASLLAANFQYPNPQWDKTRNPSITSAREFFVGDVKPCPGCDVERDGGDPAHRLRQRGGIDARPGGRPRQRGRRARRARRNAAAADSTIARRIPAARRPRRRGRRRRWPLPVSTLLLQSLPLGALAETARLDWRVFWASMTAALAASVLVAPCRAPRYGAAVNLQSVLATTRTGGVGTRGGTSRECAGGDADGARGSARRRRRPAHSQRCQSTRHRSGRRCGRCRRG